VLRALHGCKAHSRTWGTRTSALSRDAGGPSNHPEYVQTSNCLTASTSSSSPNLAGLHMSHDGVRPLPAHQRHGAAGSMRRSANITQHQLNAAAPIWLASQNMCHECTGASHLPVIAMGQQAHQA
jgi:hypothetical protein